MDFGLRVGDGASVDLDASLCDESAGLGVAGGEFAESEEIDDRDSVAALFPFPLGVRQGFGDDLGEAALAEDADELLLGFDGLVLAVELCDYVLREAELCVAGIVAFGEELVALLRWDVREEFEVIGHHIIGDGHDLSEHFFGVFGDADVIAEAFAHAHFSVGADENGKCDADLWGHLGISLEVASDEKVVGLVGAAEFDVGPDDDGVVALHEAVHEFAEIDGALGFESFFKGVALESPVDGEFSGEAQGVVEGKLGEPVGVVDDLCF